MFINVTGTIGEVLNLGTIGTTGSIFVTLMIILLIIMAMAIMFQIQLEFTGIIILPLVLSYMAYYTEWVATGTILLIYFSIILTKNWIFR